jgi:hypothetical protein
MQLSNVVRACAILVRYKTMTELTVEGIPTYVYNVAKPTLFSVTSEAIKGFTLKRNPTNVSNMGKPLVLPTTLNCMKKMHTMEKPYECKPLVFPGIFKYMKGVTSTETLCM